MSALPQTASEGSAHWQRNLYVCVFGSFTTIMAMTLLPFLPLYVQQLGATSVDAVVQWSGVAFGATFFAGGSGRAGLGPSRGPLRAQADSDSPEPRHGAITMSLLGVVQMVWQLVAIRFLAGLVGAYASGAIVMIATQTPKHRTAWALVTHAAGMMAGNLVGPLVGGLLQGLIGIRATFFLAGGLIFCSFIMNHDDAVRQGRAPCAASNEEKSGGWRDVPYLTPVIGMLASAILLMFANMSIEPIITVYVSQLVKDPKHVTLVAGIVMSAAWAACWQRRMSGGSQIASGIKRSSSRVWSRAACC